MGEFEIFCIVMAAMILEFNYPRLVKMDDFEIFCIVLSTLVLSILIHLSLIQLPVEIMLVLFTIILTFQIYYIWIIRSVYLARHLQLYGWLFIITYAFSWIIFSGVVIDYTGVVSFQLNWGALTHLFLFIWILWHFFYTFNYKFLSVVVFILALILVIWILIT